MKLENQVVSLELAKKMKELGFEQESLFYWIIHRYEPIDLYYFENGINIPFDDEVSEKYSAYTVAELGEMLPINCASWRSDKTLYSCQRFDFGGCCGQEITADTEADCRARLLIWLKENNYL